MEPSSDDLRYREPLQWGEQDPNRLRQTPAGMWAWYGQRLSAIAVVFLMVLHLTLAYRPVIQFLLLLTLTFHASLGLRIILLDFGVVKVKYQKLLIAGLLALGAFVLIVVWRSIYP
ncbi:MAG: succinate dehydrogenase [Candidatus Latescibacteria bacterium]|jgi:succinate dehydrogenase / fumarate reductase cytochrome b subunit|nr:succinate dehydrogenase [Candidatus Latescibacterota bacterium]